MTAEWSIDDIRRALIGGDVSAVDVCTAALDRIAAHDGPLHAFTVVAREEALRQAAALDADRAALTTRPLAGVPIALKDNICTRGLATTASSGILRGLGRRGGEGGWEPPYDATVVRRLRDAGAIILGKTNCDEFAMGSSTENSAYGPTRNPWALDRTPGGSSGGSAAAVAARLVPAALGSDTGGSVRQPAALCGVVGFKPTYGRVSRYGLLALGSSLDQIGPLSRTVRESALLTSIIAGLDPLDATTSDTAVPDLTARRADGLRGVRIGVPRRLLESGVEAEVLQRFEEALARCQELGASLVDVELPNAPAAVPVYYLVMTAEASSNVARYDGVRHGYRAALDPAAGLSTMYDRTRDEGFGAEVKRRIILGTYVLSAGYYEAYYLKAQQVRTLIRRDYDQAFERVDVVAVPTSPTAAFRLGERVDDPLQMYLSDVFTVSANLTGQPGISVPCGFTKESSTGRGTSMGARLPVGLQFLGRPFDEATVLGTAAAYEQATTWSRETPPLMPSPV